MIIFDKDKLVNIDDEESIGTLGDNLFVEKTFLINNIADNSISYTIHLRFSDATVNSVIPDSVTVTENRTEIIWQIKKNDIFANGYFEVQLEGRNEIGLVFQTEIVRLFANESLCIEDKEYENPNSETQRLRDETYDLVQELAKDAALIEKSDILSKEDISNKVCNRESINDNKLNYPSIQYLNDNHIKYISLGSVIDLANLPNALTNTVYNGVFENLSSNFGYTDDSSALGFVMMSMPYSSLAKPRKLLLLSDGTVWQSSFANTNTFTKSILSKSDITAILNSYMLNISESLNKKETAENKVSDIRNVSDTEINYPSIKYINDYYYNADEVDSLVLEKADSSTTLNGYGITDAEENKNKIGNKKMIADIFQNYPSIEYMFNYYYERDAVNELLDSKYDSSNIETGNGTLTPYGGFDSYISQSQFRYQRVGKSVTLFCAIKFNEGVLPNNGYIQFTGLPYVANDNSRFVSTTSKKANVSVTVIQGTWIALNFASTVPREQDEMLQFSVSYLIK